MNTIESLYKLGEKLSKETGNHIDFRETDTHLTSSGVYYEVSVFYCEDKIETTFIIDENSVVSDIHTRYKGSLGIDSISAIDFGKYKELSDNFKKLVANSKLTFEDIGELAYLHNYTY